jgi:hypothetical protein
VPEHAEREVATAAPEPAAPILAPVPTGVLALQRSAGNRAVVAMLARDTWSKDYRTRKSRQGLSYAGGRDARHALGAARRQVQEGDLRARVQGAQQEGNARSP